MANNRKIITNLVHEMRLSNQHVARLKRITKVYLNEGFDLNTKYLKGSTIIHYAVKYNLNGFIYFLAKQGANLDLCDDSYDTPLHKAVRDNKIQMVKELIKAGSDLNIGAEFEETPLHIAVSEDNLSMVKLLIESGADFSLVDEKNQTALDYALDTNNQEIINYLGMKRKKKRKEIAS